jgi:hypothetical protein
VPACLLTLGHRVNLIFVVRADRAHAHLAECRAASVLLHFFLLAALCWMLVEAVQLHHAFVAVFPGAASGLQLAVCYTLMGWVPPLVIVVVSVLTALPDYVSDAYCWIDSTRPLIWAFLGPAIIIITINVAVWLRAVRRIGQYKGARLALKASVSLGVLVGATWALAFVVMATNSLVAQFFFTICNSFQGVSGVR